MSAEGTEIAQPGPAIAAGQRRKAVQKAVGSRMRYFRRAMRLSRADIGAIIGRTRAQIANYEAGNDSISAGHLYLISVALRIPVSALFEGIDEAGNTTTGGIYSHESAMLQESTEHHRYLIHFLDNIKDISTRHMLRKLFIALRCSNSS